MATKRDSAIDFLRATAILAMIVIHVISNDFGSALINEIWNFLHFAVVFFIFCSGYVWYLKYKDTQWNVRAFASWLHKRTFRLLPAYYGFTALHYALWYLFPSAFSGLGIEKSLHFILASVLLVGVDYGWLPLLFLELAAVSPLVLFLYRKRTTRYVMTAVLAASAALFFFRVPRIDYRLIMWLPWSLILVLSFYLSDMKRQHSHAVTLIGAGLFSAVIFIAGTAYLLNTHAGLTLTQHKYPPDLWYFSYGIAIGAALLPFAGTRILKNALVIPVMSWISTNSYPLFFLHYLVMDALLTLERRHGLMLSQAAQSAFVIAVSLGLFRLYDLFRQRKSAP